MRGRGGNIKYLKLLQKSALLQILYFQKISHLNRYLHQMKTGLSPSAKTRAPEMCFTMVPNNILLLLFKIISLGSPWTAPQPLLASSYWLEQLPSFAYLRFLLDSTWVFQGFSKTRGTFKAMTNFCGYISAPWCLKFRRSGFGTRKRPNGNKNLGYVFTGKMVR